MQPSNPLSTQHSQNNPLDQQAKKNKLFALFFLLLAIFGFGDATYLTVKHISGASITCSVLNGCDTVTSSSYSEILGIPVALLGTLYYLAIIVLAIAFLDRKKTVLLSLLSKLTVVGLIASIYFVSIQAFVINEYCLYCMGSAISSTLLFILGMTYLKKQKNQPPPPPLEPSE